MTFAKQNAALGGFNRSTINDVAFDMKAQRGLSLFHCHMQLHMDFGFMALFDCT